VAGSLPDQVAVLRGALDAFLGSISRAEAVTVSEGVSLPDALARAKLGATIDAAELVPLLDDARPSVRAESARMLGELGAHSALPRLTTARQHDVDANVRAEASIAAAQLGEPGAVAALPALLVAPSSASESLARARRAALALAVSGRTEALPVLAALAADELATESDRLRAVRALGALGSPLSVAPLIATLAVVRLREASAQALAQLGGPEAVSALHAQLAEERYPPARGAEAAALLALGDPGLSLLVRRYLGMQSSLPHGVRVLGALSALTPPSRQGALLSEASVRRGSWTCGERGCAPERGAQLVLPRRGPGVRGPVRVTLWFEAASQGAALWVDGVRLPLSTTEDQLSFERPAASSAERFSLAREGEVVLLGVTVLPSLPEIPPPAPLPWKSDAESDAGSPPPTSTSQPAR
jgi:HEAT repeat protein